MRKAWLMAGMVSVVMPAFAEEGDLTDSGVSFQLKSWVIRDAFTENDENFVVGYIRPYYAWQPDPGNLFLIKGNLYASNRQGADETSISTRDEARNFAEISEMWWRHRFNFDRQSTFIGIQRFEDYSGLWWDAPLTGASYRFDGTLLKGYLALGDRSSYLRTDWDVDDPEANSGIYALAQLSWQWRLDQFLMLRAAHRQDKDNEYGLGQSYDAAELQAQPVEASWAGIEVQGERRRHEDHWPRYLIEGAWTQGEEQIYGTTTLSADSVQIKSKTPLDIEGYMARFNFEYVWQYDQRWVVGIEGFYASAGDPLAREVGFVQTGLNTNRNPLYTTSLAGSVTGEALRMTLSNIQLVGVHAAISHQDRHEGFIAVRQAWRADENDDVLLDSRLSPNGSDTLGTAFDIAYGWYMPVIGRQRGLEVGGFKGKQFMVYAAHFEPDFDDSATPVTGTVLGLRFLWAL